MGLLDSLRNILAPAANAKSSRRSFFKQAGALTATAVLAPDAIAREALSTRTGTATGP